MMEVFHMHVLHISFPSILATHLQLIVIYVLNGKMLIMVSMFVLLRVGHCFFAFSSYHTMNTVSFIKLTRIL